MMHSLYIFHASQYSVIIAYLSNFGYFYKLSLAHWLDLMVLKNYIKLN